MKFKVTYTDVIEADNEDEAYAHLLAYLDECSNMEDVTAFNFEEVK